MQKYELSGELGTITPETILLNKLKDTLNELPKKQRNKIEKIINKISNNTFEENLFVFCEIIGESMKNLSKIAKKYNIYIN
ncbi:MAG: hypothetical protein ABH808_00625 [Candidatus Kuenenbacteria bacterium]